MALTNEIKDFHFLKYELEEKADTSGKIILFSFWHVKFEVFIEYICEHIVSEAKERSLCYVHFKAIHIKMIFKVTRLNEIANGVTINREGEFHWPSSLIKIQQSRPRKSGFSGACSC